MNNRQSSGGTSPKDEASAQMEKLIRIAGKSIGQDGNQVLEAMQSGSVEQLAKALPPEQAQRLLQVLGDPEETQRLLSSKQAKWLFEMFSKK